MVGGVKPLHLPLAYDDIGTETRLGSSMPQKRSSASRLNRSSVMPALRLGLRGNKKLNSDKHKANKSDSKKLSLPRLTSLSSSSSSSSSEENDSKCNLNVELNDNNEHSLTHLPMANSVTQTPPAGQSRSNGATSSIGTGVDDAGSKLDKYHPARRKEKVNDWRDVKSKMRRRMYQPTYPTNPALLVKDEEPVFRRLTPEETLQRRSMPMIELPPDYVGPILPGERVSKVLPEIGGGGAGKMLTRLSTAAAADVDPADRKTAIKNFKKNCLKREPLETIRENKCAEHELETGFWHFFDEHFKI